MKAKDLILIALIWANVTLAAVGGALWVARAEPQARAESQMRAGDYIFLTGQVTSSREALMVIDVVAQRANLYVPEAGARAGGSKWQFAATKNLAQDFRSNR